MVLRRHWLCLIAAMALCVSVGIFGTPARAATKAAKIPAFFVSVNGTQQQTWEANFLQDTGMVNLRCNASVKYQHASLGDSNIAFTTEGRGKLLGAILYESEGKWFLQTNGTMRTTVTEQSKATLTQVDGCPDPNSSTSSRDASGCGTKTGRIRFGGVATSVTAPRAGLVYLESYDRVPDVSPCPKLQEAVPVANGGTCLAIEGVERASSDLGYHVMGMAVPLDVARFRSARTPFTIDIQQTHDCLVPVRVKPDGSIATVRVVTQARFTFYPGTKCGFNICTYKPLPKNP